MNDSVLTLGEKIVLAARLAAIEHVRQELDAAAPKRLAAKRTAVTVGDRRTGFTDEPDASALSRPVPTLLAEYFGEIAKHTPMPRNRSRGRARKEAA